MRPITLEMLAIRLASVRNAVGNDQQPVTAVINGQEVGLSVTNFQIDDQGRILLQLKHETPEPEGLIGIDLTSGPDEQVPSYWTQFNQLQRYSFWLGNECVMRVPDRCGLYVEQHKAGEIVEDMEETIRGMRQQLAAEGYSE